ncbi:ANTAR domain-containing response regulator [Sporosarcina sp. HYO08]|uniref:ANTAR domain-containing response regulator n=1 Tax=Sporosarcina sp. HYO08 TaxID=1759557 RepID=UPI000791FDA3|nr:response regulator [Sporosarcina sp. HYO08]KXH83829.1 Fis family transcriptional regulator [Sporosarcina sp. HYO08]
MSKKILIVEDESIIRMDMKMMLEDHGYEVVGEAGDGDQAIELAFQEKPDLVLMDIKMPRMNGLKASQVIASQLDIPILIITAYSQKEFVEQARQDNIVGYLVKPISESNLIPAVEIAMHQANKAKKLKLEIKTAQHEVEKRKLIERAKGILMDKKMLTEQEAFKKMRDASMARQMTMESIAKEILYENK